MKMKLFSTAFNDQEMIPTKYTCEGDGISPELSWQNVPKDTKSLVLIMDDPDAPAGTWVHWILYNIPPAITNLAEDIKFLPQGILAGVNTNNKKHYSSPCPPSGVHRYFFKLYALDTGLNLTSSKITSDVLQAAMRDHILDKAVLMGRYQKSSPY